jgi:TonB family protein
MRPSDLRPAHLLVAALALTLVCPAEAAMRKCAVASAAGAAAAGSPCKAKRPASRGRLVQVALIERELPWFPPLTEAEARLALERDLSLKVGKHMRATDYPDEAQRWRWSGTALVEVVLTPEGYVQQVALSRTSGFRLLDERALEVVRRVPKIFVPAQLRGRPQRAIVPIGFHLKDL